MAIDKLTDDLAIISKLGTYPNTDDNLSAEELKAKFDEAVLIIQKYINSIIVPAVNSASTSVTGKLNRTGGTMLGDLDMNGNHLKGLPDPTEDSDAVTMGYVAQMILDVAGFSGQHNDLKGRDAENQHPIEAIIGLVEALKGKAPYVHDHDGRYYTEDEVAKMLESYAASDHKHSASDVGALPGNGGTVGGTLTLAGDLILTEGVNYGTLEQRPASGVKGRVYFRKVGS